jgi:ribosomal protein S18 acetylase RimI-like enzyme
MSALAIRPMRPADLDRAIDWAAAEGWNPGLADAGPFRAADPDGFLMGFIDAEPVGCISVVRYPGDLAFLGFYIVRPEWRRQGHGLALWHAGMAHAQGRNVGLDGVLAQQDNYRKSGFSLAHRNVRYGGPVAVEAPRDAALVAAEAVPLAELAAFDRAHFPASRDAFLRAWIAPPRRGLVLRRDGVIRGYGVVRECRQGAKIGPLFAEDSDVADRLFRALAARVKDGPVHLDVPEPNAAARALAERYGLQSVFETARMYTRADPGLPLSRIFGITTFELG